MINKKAWYNNIERVMLTVLLSAMTVILFVNVCTRTLIHYSFPWAEQAARLMLVWASFAGISWCGALDIHMKVTMMSLVFKKHPQRFDYLCIFGDTVAVLYSLYMAGRVWIVTDMVRSKGQILASIPWCPKWIQYFAGVAGLVGLALRIIQRRVVWFMAKKNDTAVQQEKKEEA